MGRGCMGVLSTLFKSYGFYEVVLKKLWSWNWCRVCKIGFWVISLVHSDLLNGFLVIRIHFENRVISE